MPAIVSEDLQHQIVSAVRKGNEFAAGKLKTAADAVKAPKLHERTFDVAKFRQGAVEYAGKLPAPVDVVESAFDLAERVVGSQRKLRAAAKPSAKPAAK